MTVKRVNLDQIVSDAASSSRWPTVAERKQARLDAMGESFHSLQRVLSEYGAKHGGAFILFGSMVNGVHRIDSDLDVLVDFPSDSEADAWNFAEDACWKRELRPDVRSVRYCNNRFLDAVKNAGEIRCG